MYTELNELYKNIINNNFINFNNENDSSIIFDVSFDSEYSDLAVQSLCEIYSYCENAIKISHSGHPRFINNNSTKLLDQLNNNISKAKSYGMNNITYQLKIDKKTLLDCFGIKKDNINFSFFWSEDTIIDSFNSIFTKDIIGLNYIDINFYNVIIIPSSKSYFYNEFITITDINHLNLNDYKFSNNSLLSISKKREFRKDNCHLEFNLGEMLVDLFLFDFNNINFSFSTKLKSSLNSIIIKLILVYLCNIAILDDNNIRLKFKGEKVIDIDLPRKNLIVINNIDKLIELYEIAYSSVKIDMLYMVRNTISLYVCDDCNLSPLFSLSQNLEEIIEACKYNLHISSINNVNNYFSTRYTLFDFLDNNTQKIKDQVSLLISKMNTTFLGTIASLVGVSLVYLKEKNITILKIALFIYSLYLIIDFISTFSFNFFSYRKILSEFEEKKKVFEPLLKPFKNIDENYIELKSTKRLFNIYYFTYAFIYILMIFICIFSFFNLQCIINFLKVFFA